MTTNHDAGIIMKGIQNHERIKFQYFGSLTNETNMGKSLKKIIPQDLK